jgi:hypothetical protein
MILKIICNIFFYNFSSIIIIIIITIIIIIIIIIIHLIHLHRNKNLSLMVNLIYYIICASILSCYLEIIYLNSMIFITFHA